MAQRNAMTSTLDASESRLSRILNHSDKSETQDIYDHSHARRDSGYESSAPFQTSGHRKTSSISLQATSRPPVRRFYSNAETSIAPRHPVRHKPGMSASRSSSRPTTSHRTHSSRSSFAPSSRQASNPTRRSSFLLQPLTQAPVLRPSITQRAASAGTIHLFENPFLPQNSRQTPHTETAIAGTSSPTPINQHLRSSSFPSRSPACHPQQPLYSNYVPATTIDWTLPSTRKKEYEEIDRHCRGLRGLWRKMAPRFCTRNKQAGFFDDASREKDNDSGSVRRYRLDLEEEEDESGSVEKDEKPKLIFEGRRVKSG